MKTRKLTGTFAKASEAAASMPALSHYRDRTQPWSPAQSDVIAWLAAQPAVANYLLAQFANADVVRYDSELRVWKGTAS